MTRHRAPSQYPYPLVTIGSIRRMMRRAMLTGLVVGAGLTSIGWFIFYLRECAT